ncbi:hypothetical protein NIES22_72150 (plasmid) [Calothrix brevissima NIES-22]|nr:hypothetical protein NIES22_72150 [Calothrix brevissima NIES-22]
MPIATEILSGEKADDPLYIPAIERVRSTIKQSELLYIGDCKMASIGTRTHIVLGGDFYLCPLNAKQSPREKLIEYLQPVWDIKQELTIINYDYADGKTRDIAVRGASRREGFELKFLQKVEIDGQRQFAQRGEPPHATGSEISWEERQLVVRSFAIAQTEENYLRERIQKSSDALEQLKIPRRGKKKLTSPDEWESSVAAILKRYRTNGLFKIDIQTQRVQKAKRRY